MVDKENTIYFYDLESDLTKKEHIFLNNFDKSIFIDHSTGLEYLTVEHYYQAHKFVFENILEEFKQSHETEFKEAFETIRTASDADKCKKAARSSEKKFEKEWDKDKWHNGFKDYIMRRGLMMKFSQNPDLLKRLIETGEKRLVEESYKDPYWGGMLPDSKNKLGDFLYELRQNFNNSGKIYLKDADLDAIELTI